MVFWNTRSLPLSLYESKAANVTCPVMLTRSLLNLLAGYEDYIYREIWANRKQRNLLNGYENNDESY